MSIKEIPNRQWKFLIIDEGEVTGTDDQAVACEHALSSVVIEAGTCKIIDSQTYSRNIPEQTLYSF